MRRRRFLLAPAALAVLGVASTLAAATPSPSDARAGSAGATRLLPDLESAKPAGLDPMVKKIGGRTHFLVGFITAAENVGAGPVLVHASRPSTDTPTMKAEQIVMRSDGTQQTVPGAGTLKYNISPSHQHWHLQQFMTYELRRASDYRQLRPGEKTGFCLGDRYPAPWDVGRKLPRLTAKPTKPVYTGDCGGRDPQALGVDEGISVGYGDDYEAFRDGQQFDVTGLPAGLYLLVVRVNVPHRLVESSYRNNTSSALFELEWPHGPKHLPKFVLRGRCYSDHCRPQP